MSFELSFMKNLACGAFFFIENLVCVAFYCSVVLSLRNEHADACKPRVSQLIARILQLFVSILTETISEKRLCYFDIIAVTWHDRDGGEQTTFKKIRESP